MGSLARLRSLLLVPALLAGGTVTAAQTFDLQVDPAASDVQITIELTFGSTDVEGPRPLVFSGDATVLTTLVNDPVQGTVVADLRFLENTIQAQDETFTFNVINLIPFQVTLESQGLAGGFQGPTLPAGPPTAPGTSELDLTGLSLVFDQGLLDATVTPGGIPSTTDLSVSPLVFDATGTGTAVATPAVDGLGLELTLPIDQSAVVTEQGVTVNVTLQGDLVLRGSLATAGIPTLPAGLAALLGTALAAAGARALRRRG